jgi:hypothetical protein
MNKLLGEVPAQSHVDAHKTEDESENVDHTFVGDLRDSSMPIRGRLPSVFTRSRHRDSDASVDDVPWIAVKRLSALLTGTVAKNKIKAMMEEAKQNG